MVFVEVCVGSSCHLKGAPEIVELMQSEIEKNDLGDYIVLSGSFCTGKCNRVGVTVTVNEEIFPGITKETFREFWADKVMKLVEAERN